MRNSVQAVQDAVQDETVYPAQEKTNINNRIGVPVQQCRGFTRAHVWKKNARVHARVILPTNVEDENFSRARPQKTPALLHSACNSMKSL